jgi:PPK2 family polyphosphate:nucleotide phosphotransferase
MVHDELRVTRGQEIDLSDFATRSDAAWGDGKGAGKQRVKDLAKDLARLQDVFYAQGTKRLLVVLQAMDTAGKDSTIRDVFGRMNPQAVRVTSFTQPTPLELAHDYLWRVHPHVPSDGHIAIFNRSHYEDVLVVRVKGLVPEERWKRRYNHIVDFERLLVDEGTTIVKFFIHISRDEQRDRLRSRLDDSSKHWKFDTGDLATRARWDDFMEAYAEMLSRTSTEYAPWYVIPGDRKWYRKLVIGEIMVELMEGMDLAYPENHEDLSDIIIE